MYLNATLDFMIKLKFSMNQHFGLLSYHIYETIFRNAIKSLKLKFPFYYSNKLVEMPGIYVNKVYQAKSLYHHKYLPTLDVLKP